MGLFRKEFGQNAEVPQPQANSERRFEELKNKYASALRLVERSDGVWLKNLHIQDNKLYIKGSVASEHLKNQFWDQVKLVDPTYADVLAELAVEPGTEERHPGESGPGAPRPGGETYTVKPGDSLSTIAEHFYGDANQYTAIFNANRDQLSDPNLIEPGQVLTIPPQ